MNSRSQKTAPSWTAPIPSILLIVSCVMWTRVPTLATLYRGMAMEQKTTRMNHSKIFPIFSNAVLEKTKAQQRQPMLVMVAEPSRAATVAGPWTPGRTLLLFPYRPGSYIKYFISICTVFLFLYCPCSYRTYFTSRCTLLRSDNTPVEYLNVCTHSRRRETSSSH